MSKIINVKNIDYSILPPDEINPVLLIFNGQNGWIPFLVKLSNIRWTEYPIKKPRLRVGKKIANKIEAVILNVKLWIIPLCFVNHCNGLKIKCLP